MILIWNGVRNECFDNLDQLLSEIGRKMGRDWEEVIRDQLSIKDKEIEELKQEIDECEDEIARMERRQEEAQEEYEWENDD